MDLKTTMMKLVIWVVISQLFSFCVGFKFPVGGRDGWVLHPAEDYSHWAGRNRFLVNDTLYFKYKKGEDSVLEVTKDDYYNCNTSSWLFKTENGSSEFRLARSGPFFFISGVKDHCDKGQKLLLIVLSEKHRRAVSPAAAPTAHLPSISPTHHAPATSPAPESSPPERGSAAPAVTPAYSSVQSPSAPPPGSPDEGTPTATPVPAPKADASAMASALPISIALFLGSSLFYGLL